MRRKAVVFLFGSRRRRLGGGQNSIAPERTAHENRVWSYDIVMHEMMTELLLIVAEYMRMCTQLR